MFNDPPPPTDSSLMLWMITSLLIKGEKLGMIWPFLATPPGPVAAAAALLNEIA
jgi:hypothetical protein